MASGNHRSGSGNKPKKLSKVCFFCPGSREYWNFERVVGLEDHMIKNRHFDGLLGFSQGAFLTAAIPGMQEKGTALTKMPKVKFLVIISGPKIPELVFGQLKVAAGALSSPVRCPSLHFTGERDYIKTKDTKAEETVLSFFQRIRQMLSHESGFVRSLM